MNTPQWMRLTGQKVSNNSPVILSALAVAGVVTTTILAAKAWSKIEHEADGLDVSLKDKLLSNKRELAPAIISGAATVACIVGANQIGMRRNAALLGAYTITDTAFRQYKDQVVEQFGKTKATRIAEGVAERQIAAQPVQDAQVIITGGGDQLCWDTLTGRYFKSDVESIRRAVNDVNKTVLTDMYASHNEFYELVGLDHVLVGDELGWNIDNMLDVFFTSHLAGDGTPCIAINYKQLPRPAYGKL